MACCAGVMVNSIAESYFFRQYPLLGQIFPIDVSDFVPGLTLQMYIYCVGTKVPGNYTVIYQHGGGASGVSLEGLMNDMATTHKTRACVIDRLGYGYTPSFYTRKNDENFPDSGELVKRLVTIAGETGPFICAGHSAGAGECIRFAIADSNVVGVVALDGYADTTRAGAYRPNFPPGSGPPYPSSLVPFFVFVGPTAFGRGLVGVSGPDFVPKERAVVNSGLYSEARFWMSQYWDLNIDLNSGNAAYLFPRLNGSQNPTTRLISFGRTLNVKAMWIVAQNTVKKICNETFQWSTYCCVTNPSDTFCQQQEEDSVVYLEQAHLYADTLGKTNGTVVIADEHSEHDFVSLGQYVPWINDQIVSLF